MDFIVSQDKNLLKNLELTLHSEALNAASGVGIVNLSGSHDAVFIIAQSAGEVVAAATVDTIHGGNSELHKLYVDPRYRKQGIGEALVERAMAEARMRGATELCIKVTGKSSGFWRRCLHGRSGEVVENVGYIIDLVEP